MLLFILNCKKWQIPNFFWNLLGPLWCLYRKQKTTIEGKLECSKNWKEHNEIYLWSREAACFPVYLFPSQIQVCNKNIFIDGVTYLGMGWVLTLIYLIWMNQGDSCYSGYLSPYIQESVPPWDEYLKAGGHHWRLQKMEQGIISYRRKISRKYRGKQAKVQGICFSRSLWPQLSKCEGFFKCSVVAE